MRLDANEENLSRIKYRVVKACLEIIILSEADRRKIMKPTDVIALLQEKYDFKISPGTVYPVFFALEKTQQIRRLPNRRIGAYVLTKRGEQTVQYIQTKKQVLIKVFQELL